MQGLIKLYATLFVTLCKSFTVQRFHVKLDCKLLLDVNSAFLKYDFKGLLLSSNKSRTYYNPPLVELFNAGC